MSMSVSVPAVSDFMETAVVDFIAVRVGGRFQRGEVLIRLVIEMASEGDTLACPAGLTVELVAAEPGMLADWSVEIGERLKAGMRLGTARSEDEHEASADRPLRYVTRERLE